MSGGRGPTRDADLVRIFAALRGDEARRAPALQPLSWIREDPESPTTRRRRLAVAGALGLVLTIAIAGALMGVRGLSAPGSGSGRTSKLVVRKYVPPPPRIERKQLTPHSGATRAHAPRSRRIPLPWSEPMPVQDETAPPDVELLVASPPPPSPRSAGPAGSSSEPLLAGVSDVTNPRLIESTQVQPEYPEVARAARLDGNVILQAVIGRDGSVGDVTVLRSSTPGVGLEEAAASAVRRWRYEPATSGGEPVAVYFTVFVEFSLGASDPTVAELEPRSGVPGTCAESYAAIEDNPFLHVADEPLSTFSADVDTASYSNVRRFLTSGAQPPRDAVRVEELINYFDYDAAPPPGNDPFAVEIEVADCPWNPRHRLARILVAAPRGSGPTVGRNLVFLIDVSGSMQDRNKLPLLRESLALLAEQLTGRDTLSIVVYAGAAGLVLPPTPGSDRSRIHAALDRLNAGGSTAGAEGLRLAYRVAREHFVEGGVNRVILATDGDFNVGVTGHAELLEIIADDARRGVYLTALGVGMGNYRDDRLEALADRGNGNYAYLDTLAEARKVLVDEIDSTLVAVANDVKFQVEFNPAKVGAYRLVGYENRLLEHRDFNDDTRDAGEVGAGDEVTVLYELVPPDAGESAAEVDPLRYQQPRALSERALAEELFTLKVRYKSPGATRSVRREFRAVDDGRPLAAASDDFRFAASVAAFGMRLRQSEPVRDFDWTAIEELAQGARSRDEYGWRAEFVELVGRARRLAP